jgi:hypothetical protein
MKPPPLQINQEKRGFVVLLVMRRAITDLVAPVENIPRQMYPVIDTHRLCFLPARPFIAAPDGIISQASQL